MARTSSVFTEWRWHCKSQPLSLLLLGGWGGGGENPNHKNNPNRTIEMPPPFWERGDGKLRFFRKPILLAKIDGKPPSSVKICVVPVRKGWGEVVSLSPKQMSGEGRPESLLCAVIYFIF